MSKEAEYATIAHLVTVLGIMCASNPTIIINRLKSYLFTDDEAEAIKKLIKEMQK